jgi:hypothetical protein
MGFIMVEFFVVLLSGLVAISNLALAKPCNPKFNYAVKEVHNPPRQWTRVKDAPKDSMLLLRIGLKMDRWDELERHLYEGRCYSNCYFLFLVILLGSGERNRVFCLWTARVSFESYERNLILVLHSIVQICL